VDILIRVATSGDLDAIGRLGTLLVRTHHEFDARRFMPTQPGMEQGYASFIGTQLEDPDVVVLVAVRAGVVVGYLYGSLEQRDWMALRDAAGVIHDVIVDPSQRRTGIGRELLLAGLEWLREHGAPRAVLSTAQRNEAAQRLFASVGFRPTMIEMTRELGNDQSSGKKTEGTGPMAEGSGED
jgi:ribosomal protein S18 acetylase RimI-like enzyme